MFLPGKPACFRSEDCPHKNHVNSLDQVSPSHIDVCVTVFCTPYLELFIDLTTLDSGVNPTTFQYFLYKKSHPGSGRAFRKKHGGMDFKDQSIRSNQVVVVLTPGELVSWA